MLGVVLMRKKGLLLLDRPSRLGDFFGASRCVKRRSERNIRIGHRPKRDAERPGRLEGERHGANFGIIDPLPMPS